MKITRLFDQGKTCAMQKIRPFHHGRRRAMRTIRSFDYC